MSWENLVKVWQSKSLHRCVTDKAFLVLLLMEKLFTRWFCPAGFSLTVQRCRIKKKSAFELCFALSEKEMRLNSDLRHIYFSGDFLVCFFSVIKLTIKHPGFIPNVKKKKCIDLAVTCFCSLSACFVFVLVQTPKSAEIQIGSCRNNSREFQE